MKLSEVSVEYLCNYLRLDDPDESEEREAENALTAAKKYAESYTGLTAEGMDEHEDITQAVLILTADFYENKNLYLDYKSTEINRSVNNILAMHSVNLL